MCLELPSAVGGALLCCTNCPKSFCLEHRPADAAVTRQCQWAAQLGFPGHTQIIYVECNKCEELSLLPLEERRNASLALAGAATQARSNQKPTNASSKARKAPRSGAG